MMMSCDMPRLLAVVESSMQRVVSRQTSAPIEVKWLPQIRQICTYNFLSNLEPALLALLVAASSAQSLLRFEIALGSRLLHELRDHEAYRRTWLRLLAVEAGFRLAGLTCCASPGNVPETEHAAVVVPPLKASKAIFRLSQTSTSYEGGWRCSSAEHMSAAAAALWHLDTWNPDGRRLLDPDTGRSLGNVQRIALAHFDLQGCFGDAVWEDLIEGFRNGSGVQAGAPHYAHSSEVYVDIGGLYIALSLQLASPMPPGPEGGVFLHMNLQAFDDYYEKEGGPEARSVAERQKDYLHVTCLLRCGMDVERKESALLAHEAFQTSGLYGSYMREYSVFWWFDAVAQGVGHVLSLDVREKDTTNGRETETITVIEDLGNAQWNLALESGTEYVELAAEPGNEFGASPFTPAIFEGKIALVRRGGGCGFAQKALAAREAGAIGCIIYESAGDREAMGGVQFMGRNFEGYDYPDPGIPSVLVDAEVGNKLLGAILPPGRADARINIDRSTEKLRQLAPDFEAFRKAAGAGEPVHLAVLVERAERTPGPLQHAPRLSWFEDPSCLPPRFSPLLSRRVPSGHFQSMPLQL